MPSLTIATGFRCPHCRHEMAVVSRGLLGGILKQISMWFRLREARAMGGRARCGNCGRTFVVRGDRRKFIPGTRVRRAEARTFKR